MMTNTNKHLLNAVREEFPDLTALALITPLGEAKWLLGKKVDQSLTASEWLAAASEAREKGDDNGELFAAFRCQNRTVVVHQSSPNQAGFWAEFAQVSGSLATCRSFFRALSSLTGSR